MAKTATIYVQNLNEKVRLPLLKNALFELFANVGIDVREVHAKQNIKLRGQAFVVCGDEDMAEQGISNLQAHYFFGKPLRLSFSRNQSDIVKKLRGIPV